MARQESWNLSSPAELTFDFTAYLEAKFAVDSASLNAPLNARFQDQLRRKTDPRILDLGTGTGAMLRRILDLDLKGQVILVGLDQEERNLAAGLDRIEQDLIGRGYEVRENNSVTKQIRAKRRGTEIQVDLLCGDLLDAGTTANLGTFDCITAHAFMDLMPLQRAAAIVRTLLKRKGVLYSTMNYDGQTVLMPEYDVPGFERRLLRIYDRSMERRRTGGRKTGGSLSGRRLYRALLGEGFTLLGIGSSDWNVFPSGGGYSADEKLFLSAILSMIAREAWPEVSGTKPGVAGLSEWYARRIEAVHGGQLSLVVHQLDLLARVA